MKSIVKKIPLTTRVYGETRVALKKTRRRIIWWTDPRASHSRQRLAVYRDRHKGERCFILGNGPSLKRMDLSPLRHEVTFGLNRIYLLFPEMGFHTTYHVVANELVVRQFGADIAALPMPTFVSWATRDHIAAGDPVVFWRPIRERDGLPHFSHNAVRGIWEGATVTYAAMQLAYYFGFETVYLIGVDHDFTTPGQPHAEVVSGGDDPNHFHPDYFGKGTTWNLPDLEGSEYAYRLARQHFEANRRQILDATVGGKLTVFPKVDYAELFTYP